MIKNIFIKSFIIVFVFILLPLEVFSASVLMFPSKNNVGIEEEFYVDLKLDTEGLDINTISGLINFDHNKIDFVGVVDAKSMIDLWINKPKTKKDNQIYFSGIMTNGFSGVIDPFNLDDRLPGLIIRLIFKTKNPGLLDISTDSFILNLNDGNGTEIPIPSSAVSININNDINKVKYFNEDKTPPYLDAYIIKDKNIYNNKYVLIFETNDKESGIKNVSIKEGKKDWLEVESPYLLKDQSRHSDIWVKSTNLNNINSEIKINKIPYNWDLLIDCATIVVSVILLFIIIKRKYENKKIKNN